MLITKHVLKKKFITLRTRLGCVVNSFGFCWIKINESLMD